MKLYERDFSVLTEQEEAEWKSVKQREIVSGLEDLEIRRPLFHEYPLAVRHYLSLFPNNYLDVLELKDEQRLRQSLAAFRALLDSDDVTERSVLNFINSNRAYFIMGSLLKAYFPFGHHAAHLFIEFSLGTSFKVDYLLVGRSSDGWHMVFVELEAPRPGATISSGDLGAAFRKGLAQVADWDAWLEAHYSTLSESFDRLRSSRTDLPKEFRLLDKSRLHYVAAVLRIEALSQVAARTSARRHTVKSDNEHMPSYFSTMTISLMPRRK